MTAYSLFRRALVPLSGLLGLAVTFGLFAAPGVSATEQDQKVLFLTAVDPNGKSITDLTTEEVFIREDNQDREVLSVKRSTQPLAISILADTTKAAGEGSMMSGRGDGVGLSGTFSPELIRDIRVAVATFVSTTCSSRSPPSA
jgi:hypothetical protein